LILSSCDFDWWFVSSVTYLHGVTRAFDPAQPEARADLSPDRTERPSAILHESRNSLRPLTSVIIVPIDFTGDHP